MAHDYSSLFSSEDNYSNTWRELYDDSLSLPDNLLAILKRTVFLPYDYYDILGSYFLLPSALCRVIPYLLLTGQSGSGKSTLAKLASYLHGIAINSSSDTFAAIRNSLDKRRKGLIELPYQGEGFETYHKEVERNTCMVWDDIDPSVFSNSPDLYRLFKFGYDRSTDKIMVSSKETGDNLEFHCFCPKIFSSISPFHLDDRFKELKRRLIVIPCKRVEELTQERKDELSITDNDWQSKLIDLTAYDWKGFNQLFDDFWDIEIARWFVDVRAMLGSSVRGLSSQQRAISLDLMAAGIASGIWQDEDEAIDSLKNYWEWFKQETEKNAGLGGLLKDYIRQECRNATNAGKAPEIYTHQLRTQVQNWVTMGYLYEAPKPRDVKELMYDLGMRLQKGKWIKG